MYRTTAEIVSGTRVYADGKWLRCIGNKRVSVGDHIWTDGRCVYGHEQEAQQPQVITAQEDEGIPIITNTGVGYNLYTFQKNKLKQVAMIKKENGKLNLYNYVAGEFKFVGEMALEADKWTRYSLMINDFKKSIFLYDEGTNYKYQYYRSDNLDIHPDDARGHFWADTELIASNIDKTGNRFDMVIRYESRFEPYDSWYYPTMKKIRKKSVDILENGKCVKSIDITAIADETCNDCPDSEPAWDPEPFNLYNTYYFYEIQAPFIENAQTWCFWIEVHCEKSNTFLDDPPVDSEVTGWQRIAPNNSNYLLRLYLITADAKIIASESISHWIYYDSGHGTIHEATTMVKNGYSVAFPIQDGYYCKAHDWFEDEGNENYIDLKRFAYITFYNPKGNELFTQILGLPVEIPFCRVGNKYLLSLRNRKDSGTIAGETYLGADNNWQRLLGATMLNQRFRPMKKIRSWQKRLQSIEIEQKEI